MKVWKDGFKKFFSLFTMAQLSLMLLAPTGALAAVTTVVGWSFPVSQTDGVSDYGIAANIGSKYLTGVGVEHVQYNAEGKLNLSTDKAARADHWQTGDYWRVNFTTTGYETMTITSYQRSSKTGPRDYKLQYSTNDGASWSDLGGTYALPNNPEGSDKNWGYVSRSLPSGCDNQSNVVVRWLVMSNVSAEDGEIEQNGTNRIDEVFVTGTVYTAPVTYTLLYNGNGNTGGTAPTDASSPYLSGSAVTVLGNTGGLTKTGYAFDGWNTRADGSGASYVASDTFNISENTTLYAKWKINTYTVTVTASPGSGGSVSGGGTFDYNTSVTLAATAQTGYHFVDWSGYCAGTVTPFNFNVVGNVSCTANFAVDTFSVTTANSGQGDVSGGGTYNFGSDVTLVAVPQTGWHFVGWSGDCTGTDNPYQIFEISSDLSCTANFDIDVVTVNVSVSPLAGGTAVGGGSFDYGDSATLTATPNVGYHFVDWSGDCTGTSNPYILNDLVSDKSCTANFALNVHSANFDVDGVIASVPTTFGSPIQAPPDPVKPGYTFVGWTPGFPETMPDNDLTFVAQWQINQYTITFDSNGGSAVAPITQNFGTVVTAPINPTRAGFGFTGWTPALPATMPAANLTLVAGWTVLIPLTPPIIPAVTTTPTVTAPTAPAVAGAAVAPTTTENTNTVSEQPAVKGSSAKTCPWWWIVTLVAIVALAFVDGFIRGAREDGIFRRYYYVWPLLIAGVAWIAHYYLHDSYSATWFCENFWLIAILLAILGELSTMLVLGKLKQQQQ